MSSINFSPRSKIIMATEQRRKYLTTKTVFIVTIIVAVLTIIGVWLFGLGQQRSIYDNSIVSTTILSVCLFVFLTVGLYKGVKLKDNVGNLSERLRSTKFPEFAQATKVPEFFSVGEGIGGLIISIILWIVVTLLIVLFIWLFGTILWAGIIVFVAMLYWIFFRAFRLVFKNSNKCKGHLIASLGYGLFYTLLYNCWIYLIIFGAQYLTQ